MDHVSLLDHSPWPEEGESLIGQIWLTGSTHGVENRAPSSGGGAASLEEMQDTLRRRRVNASFTDTENSY